MEKHQYSLCLEVLERLHKAGILEEVVLIGSWCLPFYQKYFKKGSYAYQLRTRDIDFLIPAPHRIHVDADIPALLRDLGFIITVQGSEGYMRLAHPDLIIEFLVPEKGRGIDKPIPVRRLGVNATALRFLSFLSENSIKVRIDDLLLRLPHPVNFCLQKLIISQRRTNRDKALKDLDAAREVLKALVHEGHVSALREGFFSLPAGWQKRVKEGIKELGDKNISDIFEK